MKIFAKHALSLLNSMPVMEDQYILASFLHPKFKCLLPATPVQNCVILLDYPKLLLQQHHPRELMKMNVQERNRKIFSFLRSLMDDKAANTRSTTTTKDEVEIYIDFRVDIDKDYSNPLLF